MNSQILALSCFDLLNFERGHKFGGSMNQLEAQLASEISHELNLGFLVQRDGGHSGLELADALADESTSGLLSITVSLRSRRGTDTP